MLPRTIQRPLDLLASVEKSHLNILSAEAFALDMLAKRYAHNNVDTLRRALGYEIPGKEKKDAGEAPQQE